MKTTTTRGRKLSINKKSDYYGEKTQNEHKYTINSIFHDINKNISITIDIPQMSTLYICPITRHPKSTTSGSSTQPLVKWLGSLIQCMWMYRCLPPWKVTPPPPPVSISWARRGAITTSHAREWIAVFPVVRNLLHPSTSHFMVTN